MKEFIIDKNNDGVRLNKFMQKVMPKLKTGEIYKALRKKKVRVNKKHEAADYRLSQNDVVSIYLNDELFEKDVPKWVFANDKITVIYEDKNIIVMDKPSGLLSQDENDSLESRMRAYLYKKGEVDLNTFIPSLCHRIDRNTRGLLIGAKTGEALREINEKIKSKEIRKFYLLKTERTPKPESGVIEGYMIKDEKARKMVFCDKKDGAVYCKTAYKTLKKGEPALVEAELFTGRTHQIRAGFQRLNAALVGDVKYGAKKTKEKDYQQLISYKIVFDFKESKALNNLCQKEIALKDI